MKPLTPLLLMATLSLGSAAHATIITFTDRDAFNAAAGALNLIDFESFGSPTSICGLPPPGSPPCSLTTGGVTFTTRVEIGSSPGVELGPALGVGPYTGGNGSFGLFSSAIPAAPGDFTLSFKGSAFGVDLFGSGDAWPYGFLFTETDGGFTDRTLTSGASGAFFGAISDVGFLELSIFSRVVQIPPGSFGTANFVLDNVVTQNKKAVPEPSSIALLAAGVALLAWSSQRRRTVLRPQRASCD